MNILKSCHRLALSLRLTSMRLAGLTFCLIWMAAISHAQVRVLIIDGVNNHDWAAGTAGIRSILDEAGGFRVDVSTVTPEMFDQWNPDFARYQVVINIFNGGNTDKGVEWPERIEQR